MTSAKLRALGFIAPPGSNVAKRIPSHDHQTLPGLPDAEPPQQARALDCHDARKTPGAGCPLVSFTLCRVRLLDVDAKWGSVKDLLDGLQYAGLIHGDKEGQVRLAVWQEKVASFKDEKTVIEIEWDESPNPTSNA